MEPVRMTRQSSRWQQEPAISVGLLDRTDSVAIPLRGKFQTSNGRSVGPGEIRVHCRNGVLHCSGCVELCAGELLFEPQDVGSCQFTIEAVIGIDFHWQQKETQSFRGALRLIAEEDDRLTVINQVPLEIYITSVICSEMNAASPPAAIRSHAVISRSWLLAQLEKAEEPTPPQESAYSHIRWTEREAHAAFDVCADDHCQRYQGIGRADSPEVAAAIADTRGQVLTWDNRVCDARFSKCCGGVVEEFQTAWGDVSVPYLVAFSDNFNTSLPQPPLTDEEAFRSFLDHPPASYCNCSDESILARVLNDYDFTTRDFFRWQERLDAAEAGVLVAKKLGIDLGRLNAIEPVERGPSGRLKRLRLVGKEGSVEIGKELEIRRVLSPSHLYSSAFVIDKEGSWESPDTFILTGAGWGHGVGLCQIGAAVMACQGIDYVSILNHYYPGTELERLYS